MTPLGIFILFLLFLPSSRINSPCFSPRKLGPKAVGDEATPPPSKTGKNFIFGCGPNCLVLRQNAILHACFHRVFKAKSVLKGTISIK